MVNGDNTIWNTRANYKVGKFKVGAMYLKGDDDSLKKLSTPMRMTMAISSTWAGMEQNPPKQVLGASLPNTITLVHQPKSIRP